MEDLCPLSSLPSGSNCIMYSINCIGTKRRRLMDLGFIEGTTIHVKRKSPLGDPTAYLIRDTLIALRKEEAREILVKKI